MNLRNPGLYKALCDVFGAEAVKVVRPGEKMEWEYRRDPVSERTGLSPKKGFRGEEFKLNCPFCGDQKKRMQVSHMWGVYDAKTDSKNWWLVQCFNDDGCMRSLENRRALIKMLKLGKRHQSSLSRLPSTPTKQGGPVEYPGQIWWLSDMIKRLPKHSMLEYLRDRFVPPELAAYYGAGMCLSGGGTAFDGRLVIPVFERGKLVSWQAREVVDGPGPKYLGASNTTLADHWYDFDAAVQFHTRVLVEGAIDKWGFGGPAMGCFNKAISTAKLEMLKRADAKLGRRGNYCVLLDPAMNPKDLAKGSQHHIDAAMKLLLAAFPKRVFSCRLPCNLHLQPQTQREAESFLQKYQEGRPVTGFDPGSMPRHYLRKLVEKVGAAKGFKVSWELLEDSDG